MSKDQWMFASLFVSACEVAGIWAIALAVYLK